MPVAHLGNPHPFEVNSGIRHPVVASRYDGPVARIILPALAAFSMASTTSGEVHRVVASEYHHTFSAAHKILTRIQPGDTVITKTVDSAGFDFQGVRRTKTHGNPLTGPFFIHGAEPGDALVVRIVRIGLNRATGYTAFSAGVKDLPTAYQAPHPDPDEVIPGYDYLRPWTIDVARGTVRSKLMPDSVFPAQPMLGCIGVAPEGSYSPRSGPAGYWGGNIDYNRIRAGTTVILPVFHPGGLLFFGDGHALQGDGEAIGSGVETSLDVEIIASLRKGARLTGPRAETEDEIISIGSRPESNLNQTLDIAMKDMLRWLIEEHGMSPAQAHLLLGVQARLDLVTMGGSVAVRIPKRWLPVQKK